MKNLFILLKKTKDFVLYIFIFSISGFYGFILNNKNFINTIKSHFQLAGLKNFILAKKMLKKNLLIDAKFRFLIAKKFKPHSEIVNYYLSYIYFHEGKLSKAANFLHKNLKSKKYRIKIFELVKMIEKDQKIFEH